MDKLSVDILAKPEVFRRRLKRTVLAVMAVAFLAAMGFSLNFTSRPGFCGRCHEPARYANVGNDIAHKGIACLACHRDPGLLGAVSFRIRMVGYASAAKLYFRRHRPVLATDASAACAGCHDKIIRNTILTQSQIKISHKEIASAGLGCARCHTGIGHEAKSARSARPMHDYCFSCHGSGREGRGCSVCHIGYISVGGPDPLARYPKVYSPHINECTGCHTKDSCGNCHPTDRRLIQY